MRRRTFILVLGAIFFSGHRQVMARGGQFETPLQRMARIASRELEYPMLEKMRVMGEYVRSLPYDAMEQAIMEDYRSGRTLVVEHVLLTEHEVAYALSHQHSSLRQQYK